MPLLLSGRATLFEGTSGYQTATIIESPNFQGTTFGNTVVGGLMGMVVDAASGANFDYPNEVKINMAPDLTAVPPHASPACRPPAPEPLGDDHSARHLPSEAFGELQPVTDPIAAQLTVKGA